MKTGLILMSLATFAVLPTVACASGCPKTLDDWELWRDQAINELLSPRPVSGSTAAVHIDLYGVMAASIGIANFIDDCYTSFSPSPILDSQIGNLRKFTNNFRNNVSIPDYDDQFGYDIDDLQYLHLVKDNVDLPALLKSQEFLHNMSNPRTYQSAYRMITDHNNSLPPGKQWTVFMYRSRFLTTPDNAETYGRLFVLVPGDKYDKWIQFGIKLPGDSTSTPVNNLSIVSVAQPDSEGRRFNAIIDWWRTYRADGTILLEPRRISQGVTENCITCHKTSPLGIHPAKEYVFDHNGDLVPNATNAGIIPDKLNSLIPTYGAPYFGLAADPKDSPIADTSDYGPPLGEDIQRSDDFMSYCTQGLNVSQQSTITIKQHMTCTKCHSEKGAGAVGLLNFPETLRNEETSNNQIYVYVTEGWMPPSRQLPAADRMRLNQASRSDRVELYEALVAHEVDFHITMSPDERKGLYRCLMKEYFDIDKQTGTLLDWLRSNNNPSGLMNVAPSRPYSQPVKPHDHD